jgi:hypothetical protein
MNQEPLSRNDLEMSLEVLLCLTSGYQGSFVAQEILLDLNHPSKPEATLQFADKMLSSIVSWNKALIQEERPLIISSWEKPESENARLAMKMLDNLRLEHREINEIATMIVSAPQEELSESEMGWCVAQFGRYTYAAREYFRLLYSYAEASGDEQLKDFALRAFDEKENASITLNNLAAAVKSGEIDTAVRSSIMAHANRLPRNAKATVHEILLSYYCLKPYYTYDMFGIEAEEGQEWEYAGFDPIVADTWLLNGIESAAEALEWINNEFTTPLASAYWKDARFSANEAASWFKQGLTPDEAREWKRAGFAPEKAQTYIEKGMKKPPGKSKPKEKQE